MNEVSHPCAEARIDPTQMDSATVTLGAVDPAITILAGSCSYAPLPAGGATSRVAGAAEATDLATFPLELN